MRCVVTGAAGFVGSHLCEELLRRGHTVVGVDCFTPHYPAARKAANQQVVLAHPHYHFHAADLRRDPLDDLAADADAVFHLAAMSGPPRGWADLDAHWAHTVQATHRLLDALRPAGRLRRLVFASSGAVYGCPAVGPEDTPPRPASADGVAKLAAEHLVRGSDLPAVTVRLFGVYGPRQWPDGAAATFARALLDDRPIDVHGDGRQVRAPVYVSDAVSALIAAVEAPAGEAYNVGGAEPVTVLDLLARLERASGRSAVVAFRPPRPGDPRQAVADLGKIRRHLGWRPTVGLDDGLARPWHWHAAADAERPADRRLAGVN